jgi:hypothetical protein
MDVTLLFLIPILTLILSFIIYDLYNYFKNNRQNIIYPQERIVHINSLVTPTQKVMI